MSYRSKLARKVTKAITAFDLIEDGDRVMVGLSGGKDSWALMQVLDGLRRRAPVDFSLIAVNVDSGYEQYKHHEMSRACESLGWEYRIEHTQIGAVMDASTLTRRRVHCVPSCDEVCCIGWPGK